MCKCVLFNYSLFFLFFFFSNIYFQINFNNMLVEHLKKNGGCKKYNMIISYPSNFFLVWLGSA